MYEILHEKTLKKVLLWKRESSKHEDRAKQENAISLSHIFPDVNSIRARSFWVAMHILYREPTEDY